MRRMVMTLASLAIAFTSFGFTSTPARACTGDCPQICPVVNIVINAWDKQHLKPYLYPCQQA